MAELTKRELVKEAIESGTKTKAQISEELEMSASSVSTQMTYLRWMGLFILTDAETKILSFTDEETFKALEAAKAANKSTRSTSTRSPEDRAVATAKAIANQEKAKAKWEEKLAVNSELAEDHPNDEDIALNIKEAEAQIVLHEVKLIRNNKLAETLPDPAEAQATLDAAKVEESNEVEAVEVEETEELL